MSTNRYTNLAPTTFDDITLFQPAWEGLDQQLAQQQQQYDVARSLADKAPKHLQKHAPQVQQYMGKVRKDIDQIAQVYASEGVSAGNKYRNELLRRVSRDWQPGGQAYAFEDVHRTVNTLISKYDEQFKDDPSYMNKYAKQRVYEQIQDWDYDATTGKYSNVVDPNIGEYINIQKEMDDLLKGYKEDGWEKVQTGGTWYLKKGEKSISAAEVRDTVKNFLGEERYAQQLDIEQWSKYGFSGNLTPEQTAQLTEEARGNAMLQVDAEVEQLAKMLETEDGIKQVQMMLKQSGHYQGGIDGDFGEISTKAFADYIQDRKEQANQTAVSNEYFKDQIKENYTKSMMNKYGFRATTEDAEINPFALAKYKSGLASASLKAMLVDLQPPQNVDATSGATVDWQVTPLRERIKASGDNLKAAGANIFGKYDMATKEAFMRATQAGPDGNTVKMVNPYKVAVEGRYAWQQAMESAQAQGLDPNSKEGQAAIIAGYQDAMKGQGKAGNDFSMDALAKQAMIFGDETMRSHISNDLKTYDNALLTHQANVQVKNQSAGIFFTSADGDKFIENKFNAWKPQLKEAGITDVAQFKQKVLNNAKIDAKGSIVSANNITNGILTLSGLVPNLAAGNISTATLQGELDDAIYNSMENNAGQYGVAQNAVIFVNETANKAVNRDLKILVESTGLGNLASLEGLSANTLSQLGYDSDSKKKDGHKLKNVSLGTQEVAGKQQIVMNVRTEWKGGEGAAIIPFPAISKEVKDDMLKTVFSLQVDDAGNINSDPQSQKNATVMGETFFDENHGETKLNDSYLYNSPLGTGESQDLGRVRTTTRNGQPVDLYVVRHKTDTGLSDAFEEDDFYLLDGNEYKAYQGTGEVPTYLRQSGTERTGRVYESFSGLKSDLGQREMLQALKNNPNIRLRAIKSSTQQLLTPGQVSSMFGALNQ